MFIGPCIIVIVEEWKTNLMSPAILFHFLCAQHVSDINISIIRSLRLCCSFCRLKPANEHHPKPAAPNLQHTTNWEQDDGCGNSTTQSQAPDDGYTNVRNMCWAHKKWNKIASDIKLVFHSSTIYLCICWTIKCFISEQYMDVVTQQALHGPIHKPRSQLELQYTDQGLYSSSLSATHTLTHTVCYTQHQYITLWQQTNSISKYI